MAFLHRLWVLATALLLAACAQLDPYNMIGRQIPEPEPTEIFPGSGARAPLGVEERQRAFDFVWNTIKDRYYRADLNGVDWDAVGRTYRPLAMKALDDEAFWDVLDRMTGELKDAHTRVESPKRAALRRLDQTVTLGFSFKRIGRDLVVTRVHPETDAYWAGVRPGMIIVSIGNEEANAAYARLMEGTRYDSTERSRHLQVVRRLVSGDEGAKVQFTFQRGDGSRFDANLGRSKLTTRPAAMHRVLPSGYGYVRLTQWTLGATARAVDGLKELKDTPGLIVDLRTNPGGSLHAVSSMLSKFFPEKRDLGRIVTRTGQPISMLFGMVEIIKLKNDVPGDAEAYKNPVVVLVNDASASGSEFFSATMQAANRAVVVGEPTCGCLLGFLGYARVPGGGDLAYSEVGFEMSNGKRIEGEGVIPNHEVALTVQDLLNNRDRTLEQAEEILRNMKPGTDPVSPKS